MDTSELTWNHDLGLWEVGVVGNEIVRVVPMIYNHRVTISPIEGSEWGYSHAWCYADLTHALIAIERWEPLYQAEPVGCLKRATPGLRVAPGSAVGISAPLTDPRVSSPSGAPERPSTAI